MEKRDTRSKALIGGSLILVSFMAFLVATARAVPDPVATKMQGADTNGNPVQAIIYPAGSTGSLQTAISSTSTGAAQQNNATLAGTSAKTTFIAGFAVTGGGATGASNIAVTVTGTIGGTLNFTMTIPAGATTATTPLIVSFNPPLAASSQNVSIVVTVPTFGAGNTAASTSAWGFQQ